MDGWMDGQMDGRTDRRADSPCILQDFVPLRGPLPKKAILFNKNFRRDCILSGNYLFRTVISIKEEQLSFEVSLPVLAMTLKGFYSIISSIKRILEN